MKQEINSLKRQVKFYKEKLQLELLTSIKKTDLMVKVNKKNNKNNVLKTSGNNSMLDGKAKTDFIHDMNNTKINELFDDLPSKDGQIEENFNKPEENGNSNSNVTIDKIPSFHSNEKTLPQNCNNIIPERKRIVAKREKMKATNYSPKFNKIVSKSPHNTFLSKEHNYNSKNTCPNNNANDKTKINLNKYLNDTKGSNEKLSYTTVKPEIPHTSKNNKNLNVNKINDMINSAKNRSNLPSPKNPLKKEEENDKEVVRFLGNIAAKFDEELENLTEMENLLINSKLDLKNADKNEVLNKENELNTSHSLEKKNNFLSINNENYQNDILINKGKVGKSKKPSKFI